MTDELLTQILKQTKKEATFSKVIAFIMLGVLLILLIATLIVVPRALSMITEIERTALDAQAVVAQATETLGGLSATVEGVEEMTESITKTGNALFDGIGKVNFDDLAQAITDLQDAIEPLANFSRMLNR
ncbi:MAG: hypothetical protein IJQ21_05015 [Lachnospiraceae bacterium]|nr:hypothetical protein [Lachnospiraceae bacterium]